jgi:hypothetical protein
MDFLCKRKLRMVFIKRFTPVNLKIIQIKLIDWCLTPTLAVLHLYRGVSKFYINLRLQIKKGYEVIIPWNIDTLMSLCPQTVEIGQHGQNGVHVLVIVNKTEWGTIDTKLEIVYLHHITWHIVQVLENLEKFVTHILVLVSMTYTYLQLYTEWIKTVIIVNNITICNNIHHSRKSYNSKETFHKLMKLGTSTVTKRGVYEPVDW